MNATKTVIIAMILALAIIGTLGMTSAATTYDSSVILENKVADEDWNTIPDEISALIEYNSVGEEFSWHAVGVAEANTEYSLIYYADRPDRHNPTQWGGDNPGALIGTMMTDGTGAFESMGSVELNMDLPHPDDYNAAPDPWDEYCNESGPDGYDNCCGAKLWMVPSDDYDAANCKVIYWHWADFLFETELITYEDCDEFYPGAPLDATFSIGDAFNGDTVPIMVLNATNAGSVDMTLTYNASLVEITGISGGDMDAEFWNEGTGQVRIGAYQTNSPGIDGDFAIAYVTFASVGEGSCDLCEFGAFDITVTTYKDATPCGRSMTYDVNTGVYCACINGDVNCDGDVDMFDAFYIAKHSIGISGFENICECAADVNGSGDVEIHDAMYLAKYILEFEEYDPLR